MSGNVKGQFGILSAPPYPRARGLVVDASTFNQAMAQIERSFASDELLDGANSPIGSANGSFTANGLLPVAVPAGAMILAAAFWELAGHNVTVRLGTTATGAQILAATAVAASTIVPVNGPTFLLQAWTAPQTVFISSAAWGSAQVKATVWYLR